MGGNSGVPNGIFGKGGTKGTKIISREIFIRRCFHVNKNCWRLMSRNNHKRSHSQILGRPLANHPAFFERTSPPNSPTFKKSPQLIPVSPTFPPPPLIVTSINGEESRLMELQHEDQAVMQLEATATLNSSQKLWLYEELKLERSVLVIHKMLQASAFIILHKLYGAAIRPFAQWIILKNFKDWDKKVKSKGEVILYC